MASTHDDAVGLLSLPEALLTFVLCAAPLDAALRFGATCCAARLLVSDAAPQLWRALRIHDFSATNLDAAGLRCIVSSPAAAAHTRELDVSGLLVTPSVVLSLLRSLPQLRCLRARALHSYFTIPQALSALRNVPRLRLLECDLHVCATWGNAPADRRAVLCNEAVQLSALRIDGCLSSAAVEDLCAALTARRIARLDVQWSLYFWHPAEHIRALAAAASNERAVAMRSVSFTGYGHYLPAFCAALQPAIARNTLSSIAMRAMRIEAADVLACLRAVADNKSLLSLTIEPFACLALGATGGAALGRLLACHPSLETVSLPGLGLGPLGAIAAATGLALHAGKLRRLNLCLPDRIAQRSEAEALRGSAIGDTGALALAAALQGNGRLRTQLHYCQLLEGNDIGDEARMRLYAAARGDSADFPPQLL